MLEVPHTYQHSFFLRLESWHGALCLYLISQSMSLLLHGTNLDNVSNIIALSFVSDCSGSMCQAVSLLVVSFNEKSIRSVARIWTNCHCSYALAYSWLYLVSSQDICFIDESGWVRNTGLIENEYHTDSMQGLAAHCKHTKYTVSNGVFLELWCKLDSKLILLLWHDHHLHIDKHIIIMLIGHRKAVDIAC